MNFIFKLTIFNLNPQLCAFQNAVILWLVFNRTFRGTVHRFNFESLTNLNFSNLPVFEFFCLRWKKLCLSCNMQRELIFYGIKAKKKSTETCCHSSFGKNWGYGKYFWDKTPSCYSNLKIEFFHPFTIFSHNANEFIVQKQKAEKSAWYWATWYHQKNDDDDI